MYCLLYVHCNRMMYTESLNHMYNNPIDVPWAPEPWAAGASSMMLTSRSTTSLLSTSYYYYVPAYTTPWPLTCCLLPDESPVSSLSNIPYNPLIINWEKLSSWKSGGLFIVNSGSGYNLATDCYGKEGAGTVLAIPGNKNNIRITSHSNTRLLHVNPQTKHFFVCCYILNDEMFVSGTWDETLIVWNPAGKLLYPLDGHTKAVACVADLKDEKIVSGGEDETLFIWGLPFS